MITAAIASLASEDDLVRATRWRLRLIAFVATVLDAAVLTAFLLFLFPVAASDAQFTAVLNRGLPVIGSFLLISMPLAVLYLEPHFRRATVWITAGRPAVEEERTRVLAYPRRYAWLSFALWVTGGVLYAAVMIPVLPDRQALAGAETIVLGGATACALQFLVVERILRPIAALAMAGGAPPNARFLPGADRRWLRGNRVEPS